MNRAERVAMLDYQTSELSLKEQAELLSVSYSSLFYKPVAPSARELAIKRRIDELYTAYPFYGSRKICELLRPEFGVSRPTVQAYMREMGISAMAPGPNTSKPAPEHQVFPYLLRKVTAQHPDHIWGIDITYIRLAHGWLYLVAVLDWYSRYVVSWALSQSLEINFVLFAVDNALKQSQPVIWNSDQGSHFTSPQYIARLEAKGVNISMDGRGRASDNIFTERLWRTIKYEEVYLHEYTSPKEAHRQISQYIQFYNNERIHQALAYNTPAQVYGSHKSHPFVENFAPESLNNHSTLFWPQFLSNPNGDKHESEKTKSGNLHVPLHNSHELLHHPKAHPPLAGGMDEGRQMQIERQKSLQAKPIPRKDMGHRNPIHLWYTSYPNLKK